MFFFIVNPKSGSSLNVSNLQNFIKYLRQQGKKVQVHPTKSLEHAGDLADQAINENAESIVTVGGDGTVRTVLDRMAGSDIPVLIIPSGTENLLACEMGLDGNLKTNQKVVESGFTRKLDLGQANDRHFMAIAGIGFDAEVVERVIGNRTGHITPLSYVGPLYRTFWEHQFPHLHIEIDGNVICDEPAMAFICNIKRYAIGLGLADDADCSDGLLDITIFKCKNRLQLIRHSAKTVLKMTENDPKVIRQRFKTATIDCKAGNAPVQLDGDPGPKLPLHINVIPSAANLLTPPPKKGKPYAAPVKHYHIKKWLLR